MRKEVKVFGINDRISILCEWHKTRTAFKHEAALLLNGSERDRTKICYVNRTWEAYEYQSVIHKLLDKTSLLTNDEKKAVRVKLDGKDGYSGEGVKEDMKGLGSIAAIAMLGDILGKDQKEKNDWKARMLKAGIGDALSMPEDWAELSEEEKEKRLNAAISQMRRG